jgi:hypothetical protein
MPSTLSPRRAPTTVGARLLVLYLPLTLCGCISHEIHITSSGSDFDSNVAKGIKDGTPADEVRRRLGVPASITSCGPGCELWKYSYTEDVEDLVVIAPPLPVVTNDFGKQTSRQVTLRFQDGKLTNAPPAPPPARAPESRPPPPDSFVPRQPAKPLPDDQDQKVVPDRPNNPTWPVTQPQSPAPPAIPEKE